MLKKWDVNLTYTSLCGVLSCVRNPLCGMIKISFACAQNLTAHTNGLHSAFTLSCVVSLSPLQAEHPDPQKDEKEFGEALVSPYPAWILLSWEESGELGDT